MPGLFRNAMGGSEPHTWVIGRLGAVWGLYVPSLTVGARRGEFVGQNLMFGQSDAQKTAWPCGNNSIDASFGCGVFNQSVKSVQSVVFAFVMELRVAQSSLDWSWAAPG
jgi:hypothetical protein